MAHRLLATARARPLALPALVGLTALAIAIVVTVAGGFPPAPSVHDEFSYLLSADTFAHGRLANPTHPLWEHFETFHVIHTPSYSSKYPPGNGVILALGQLVIGEPIVGVWFAYALMAGAIVWCLQSMMSVRWALWGGLLAATWYAGAHVGWGYWTASYWGGAFPAAGSALMVGALLRMRAPRSRRLPPLVLCFAAGLAILATTRPFEGLLVAILPLVLFSRILWSEWGRGRRRSVLLALVAFTGIMLPTVAGVGLHNERVTGSAFRFPYALHEEQYGSAPLLIGLPVPTPKTYRHREIACFYQLMDGGPVVRQPIRYFIFDRAVKLPPALVALLAPIAFPLLVMMPVLWHQGIYRLATGSFALLTTGFLLTPWTVWPHYAAPFVAWQVLILTEAARRLYKRRSGGRPVGRLRVRFVFGCSVVLLLASVVGRFVGRAGDWPWERARMQTMLEASGDRHLVVVSYGPRHNPHNEWVHNASDIDASPVVWARSIPGFDERLYAYFADRRLWRLHIDDDHGRFRLEPVEPPAAPAGSPSTAFAQTAQPTYAKGCARGEPTPSAIP